MVAHTLRGAVEEVLRRGLADPRIRGLISVTGVDLTDDLQDATIRVSIYPAEHQDQTMKGLHAAAAYVRREAAQRMSLRAMPTLRFVLDLSLKRQADVLAAIARARESDESHKRRSPSATEAEATGEAMPPPAEGTA